MVGCSGEHDPRRVTGDARRWKALSHPLRQEILGHLSEHEAATSTTIAEALGQNTGTTSYHLRVLADAGIIEEVTERAHGRERWWRTIAVDLREPDYDSLSAQDRAALDEWRAGQIPGELALLNRFVRDVRKHGGWAKASRASGYYTAEGLELLRRVLRTAGQVRARPPRRPARGTADAAAHVLHPRRAGETGGLSGPGRLG